MALAIYNQKRNFKSTPEPAGKVSTAKSKKLIFVVQKHQATQLHYDFRLELDDVLKSWAVPKGPPLVLKQPRLAMTVEDHPLEYAAFSGVIPEGNYGAGKVEIWDHGTYEPIVIVKDHQAELRAGLKKGHLTFIMHGSKLKGEYALIRAPKMGDKAWLLIKGKKTKPIDSTRVEVSK